MNIILIKLFATALTLSQVTTRPDSVKTQFDPESNKSYHVVIHGVPTLDSANAAPFDIEFKRYMCTRSPSSWFDR